MGRRTIITGLFFLIVVFLVNGCGNKEPDVTVNEINVSDTTYDEPIHINNCGGKGDSEHISSRSFSTRLEGMVEVGIQQVVEGSISLKYSQYRNTTKSFRLIAPPGTNMAFILRWHEEVRAGNVLIDGSASNYEVSIPIAVEQISSQDLGCGNGDNQVPSSPDALPTTQSQPAIPTQTSAQYQLCPAAITQSEVNSFAIGITDVSTVLSYIDLFDSNRYGGEFIQGDMIPAGVVVSTNFDETNPNRWMEYPVSPLVHSGSWGLFQSNAEYVAPNAGACRMIVP